MWRFTFWVILIWGLICCQTMQAQSPVVTPELPDPGDTLFYQIDELPKRISISAPGQNQMWNFATLVGPYLQYQVVQPSGDDDLLQFVGDQGNKSVYKQESMTLILRTTNRLQVGSTVINANWISEEGLAMPSADLDYQDTHEYNAVFQTSLSALQIPSHWKSTLPAGTDSIRVSVLINRNMTVDATGMLFLINGFRQESERLRVEDILTKKIWAKKGNGNWQDITSLTRLPDLQPQTKVSYHFVSLETGANLCTVSLDDNGSPDKVYFSIPKEQARFYKTAATSQFVLAYPNPALSYVRFKFIDLAPGEYTLKFYDVFMRSLFEKKYEISGDQTVEINISHLEKGPYVYSLIDRSGKKITTKRLIVIKP